jgi:uncharacterized membrane protein
MGLVWSIVGAIVGAILGAIASHDASTVFGVFGGAMFGYLLWRLGELDRRTREAEERLAAIEQKELRAGIARSEVKPSPGPTLDLRNIEPAAPAPTAPSRSAEPQLADFDAPAPPPPPSPAAAPVWSSAAQPVVTEQTERWQNEPRTDVFALIKNWFTEGNVPVKVGMLVLFAGVAALLKYAADEGWFTFPIEFRLIGIALASIAALIFAWRQRETRRSFSLSLQGGAIGILLLTVFAAFRLYHLLPATAAFALMLILVAGVCVLAVLQDALALAVLGILAGFAAPILISTGSGNHVVLFSYYAVLNVAIFAIAWQRAWRVLNLLGFFFTYAIGTVWGVTRYDHELFNSTEPFLLLYFAIYLAVPILYALKRSTPNRDAIDGTLIFGNPLAAFALQGALLEWERMPLAISAMALGIIYLILAASLIRRVRVLGESFAVLALGFSTLSVPLALSARTTGCIFALEGAAVVWLGLRQQRRLPRWIGLGLQLLAAGAFIMAFRHREMDALPIANGGFLGAMLICAAGLVCAWLYQRARASSGLAALLYFWGLAWWFGTWFIEIDRFVPGSRKLAAALGLFAASAWLAAEATRLWQRLALGLTTTALFWLVMPLSLLIAVDGKVFEGWNLIAFIAFAVAGYRSLACLHESEPNVQTATHLGWFWAWIVAFALSLSEAGNDWNLGDGWLLAMMSVPLLALFALALIRPNWIAPPLSSAFPRYRGVVLGSEAFMLALILCVSLLLPGDSEPLAFLPILNPLELFQLAALVLLAVWLRDADCIETIRGRRAALLAAAGFLLITSATLRAVHHLGNIPWNDSLLRASLSQTSLAVVWSVLGVAGWVIGSRRGNRPLWLASALLMAVVLVKLLLIDRQHLGNLFGIASFIAYGLLCTLVGYLAPAPPRQSTAGEGA